MVLCASMLFLLATQGTPGQVEQARNAFKALSKGPHTVRVFVDESGRTTSASGDFDIGLNESTLRNDEAVVNAVVAFINSQRDEWLLGQKFLITLQVDHRLPEKDITNVVFRQFDAGVPILESEIIAEFFPDGTLHALHGKMREPSGRTPIADVESVRTALERHGVDLGAVLDQGDGRSLPWLQGSGDLQYALRASTNSVAWRVVVPPMGYWVDDATLEVNGFKLVSQARSSCDVTYRTFAMSLSETTSFATHSGTDVENPTCEGDQIVPFGPCYWKLKYNQSGTAHAIDRIEDALAPQVEDAELCTPTTLLPTFSATSGAGLRQQTAYVAIQGMRYFINDNAFSQISPTSNDAMTAKVADPLNYCGAGASACYSPLVHTIYVGSAESTSLDIFMHEYGHYVNSQYGGFNYLGTCHNGSGGDQAVNLEETIGNCWGLLVAMDDPDINPQYGALSGFGNQAPGKHSTSGNKITFSSTCTANVHDMGKAFEQAFWEILRNLDCDSTSCSSTSAFNNDIWLSASEETVLQEVGESLARTILSSPNDASFSEFTAILIDKIELVRDAATAGRAQSVFAHHGL